MDLTNPAIYCSHVLWGSKLWNVLLVFKPLTASSVNGRRPHYIMICQSRSKDSLEDDICTRVMSTAFIHYNFMWFSKHAVHTGLESKEASYANSVSKGPPRTLLSIGMRDLFPWANPRIPKWMNRSVSRLRSRWYMLSADSMPSWLSWVHFNVWAWQWRYQIFHNDLISANEVLHSGAVSSKSYTHHPKWKLMGQFEVIFDHNGWAQKWQWAFGINSTGFCHDKWECVQSGCSDVNATDTMSNAIHHKCKQIVGFQMTMTFLLFVGDITVVDDTTKNCQSFVVTMVTTYWVLRRDAAVWSRSAIVQSSGLDYGQCWGQDKTQESSGVNDRLVGMLRKQILLEYIVCPRENYYLQWKPVCGKSVHCKMNLHIWTMYIKSPHLFNKLLLLTSIWIYCIALTKSDCKWRRTYFDQGSSR